jgi:hypothetical protein
LATAPRPRRRRRRRSGCRHRRPRRRSDRPPRRRERCGACARLASTISPHGDPFLRPGPPRVGRVAPGRGGRVLGRGDDPAHFGSPPALCAAAARCRRSKPCRGCLGGRAGAAETKRAHLFGTTCRAKRRVFRAPAGGRQGGQGSAAGEWGLAGRPHSAGDRSWTIGGSRGRDSPAVTPAEAAGAPQMARGTASRGPVLGSWKFFQKQSLHTR